MEIIKLTKDNLQWDHVNQLLTQQENERYYFSRLGLSTYQQHEFLQSKILKRLDKLSESNTLYALQDHNECKVLLGLDSNVLHSNMFKRNIVEIGPFYLSKEINIIDIADPLSSIIHSYSPLSAPYFKIKLDSSNTNAIDTFSSLGFKYCTTALKMLYDPLIGNDTFRNHYDSKSKYAERDYYVKVIQYSEFKEQLNQLVEQHRKSIHYYMYLNDFEESKINELFTDWFNVHSQKKQTIILGLFNNHNQLIGFTSCNGPVNISTARVFTRDLTIIDQQYKGLGLAGLLYKELNRLTGSYIEGNPLSNNYRNIKLNQNCGYSVVHSRVYLKYDSLNL